jgi:hypothetical protein
MTEGRKVVDMSGNTEDNFVVRMGHYQDHERGARSLFAQTTINDHKYWGWFKLVDKDGFRSPEKRPAIQTIGNLFVGMFKKEILGVLEHREVNGLVVVEHYGEMLPEFKPNLHSKEFEEILDDLGFVVIFNRSDDKPRIESVRIVRKV